MQPPAPELKDPRVLTADECFRLRDQVRFEACDAAIVEGFP